MYNQQQQYNQPGMVPMQQYHPQQQQYDQQQQYNQQYNQQQGIQYEQQPVATGHMPITAHMTPMGGASSSSPPLNNDPMIDGLSFFPSLVVKQKRNSLWEYLCNCEEENKYDIFNPEGPGSHKEKILTAKEKSGYCTRMCLAEKRHFNMSIKTANDEEALYFERPYRIMERGGWCCCCCACGFQALRVYSGDASKSPDTMLGYVQEDYYCLFPTLSVFDDSGNLAYKIKLKPSCQSFCCAFAKATFEIFEASDEGCKNQVGKIKKKWSGALKEIFTDADNFFIEFPKNATAKQRAVLLGALFFMDYLYYEDGGCHILHCLGAPLTGPCACLAWCCNFNSSDSGNSGLLL